MKNKLLFVTLIGVGTVVMLFMAFPFGMIISLAFWIYLGVMIWKKKRVFHEEIEPQLAAKQLTRLKRLSIVAGMFFIIAVVCIIIHNVQSKLPEPHDTYYFIIGIITLYLFILASIVGIVIFLKARQKLI